MQYLGSNTRHFQDYRNMRKLAVSLGLNVATGSFYAHWNTEKVYQDEFLMGHKVKLPY